MPDLYAQTVLADNPVAYWRLDEASGTVVNDSSGHNNTGTIIGGVTLGQAGPLVSDPSVTAMVFDGTSGYIQTTGPTATYPTFTAEAWVYLNGTQSGNYPCVITDTSTAGVAINYLIAITSQWWVGFYDGAWGSIQAGTLPLNQWAHVVVTYDGTTLTFYQNGSVVQAKTITGVAPQTSGQGTRIGRRWDQAVYIKGTIGQVAIYPAALSAARVVAHYDAALEAPPPPAPTLSQGNGLGVAVGWQSTSGAQSVSLQRSQDNATWTTIASGLTGPSGTYSDTAPGIGVWYYRVGTVNASVTDWGPSSSLTITSTLDLYGQSVLADAPAAYWRLDESSGTSVYDSSGNGHVGTITGGVTLAQTGPLVSDTSTTAYLFDGATGIITVPATAVLAAQANSTFEFWFRTTQTAFATIMMWYGNGGSAGVGVSHNILGQVVSFYSSGHGSWVQSIKPTDDGAWHHCVIVQEGTSVLFYIDGALDSTQASASMPAYDGPYYIGAASSGSSSYQGNLAQVAIYPGIALSAARVTAHYNAALAPPPPSAPTLSIIAAKVLVGWQVPAVATSGQIQRSADQTTWTTLATLPGTSGTYSDSGPFATGVTYYYRVVASNSHGSSTPGSASGIVYTIVHAPPLPVPLSVVTSIATNLYSTPGLRGSVVVVNGLTVNLQTGG